MGTHVQKTFDELVKLVEENDLTPKDERSEILERIRTETGAWSRHLAMTPGQPRQTRDTPIYTVDLDSKPATIILGRSDLKRDQYAPQLHFLFSINEEGKLTQRDRVAGGLTIQRIVGVQEQITKAILFEKKQGLFTSYAEFIGFLSNVIQPPEIINLISEATVDLGSAISVDNGFHVETWYTVGRRQEDGRISIKGFGQLVPDAEIENIYDTTALIEITMDNPGEMYGKLDLINPIVEFTTKVKGAYPTYPTVETPPEKLENWSAPHGDGPVLIPAVVGKIEEALPTDQLITLLPQKHFLMEGTDEDVDQLLKFISRTLITKGLSQSDRAGLEATHDYIVNGIAQQHDKWQFVILSYAGGNKPTKQDIEKYPELQEDSNFYLVIGLPRNNDQVYTGLNFQCQIKANA